MVAEVGGNNGLQPTGARNSWKTVRQLFKSKNTCMEDNLGEEVGEGQVEIKQTQSR